MAAAPGTGLSSSVKSFAVSVRKGKFKVNAAIHEMGPDILVAVWGGTYPHIGAIGMAQVRQSLRAAEETSATSSVFTFLGHKEDLLAKPLAEEMTRELARNSVVVAGIHWDNLTDDEIRTVEQLCRELTEKIVKKCRR
jgi:gallate decarboxylase subunit D